MGTVIITGCNSGFGLETALAFARNRDTVYATMRDTKKADALLQAAATEDLNIHIKTLDVCQPELFPPFFQDIVDETGQIDVLVNNAGILRAGAFEDQSIAAFKEVIETNFYGPMLLTRAVLPQMRKQGSGYIITISSLSGIAGLPGDVTYTAGKFAIEGAMEALRHEVDHWNIKVALVQAGLYATGIFNPNIQSGSSLPNNYPEDSPYRPLVKHKYKELIERLPDAGDPAIIADLLVKIAASDGSQLRWPADDTARMVLDTMFAQDGKARDKFLRDVSGTDWWSEGKDKP